MGNSKPNLIENFTLDYNFEKSTFLFPNCGPMNECRSYLEN